MGQKGVILVKLSPRAISDFQSAIKDLATAIATREGVHKVLHIAGGSTGFNLIIILEHDELDMVKTCIRNDIMATCGGFVKQLEYLWVEEEFFLAHINT